MDSSTFNVFSIYERVPMAASTMYTIEMLYFITLKGLLTMMISHLHGRSVLNFQMFFLKTIYLFRLYFLQSYNVPLNLLR